MNCPKMYLYRRSWTTESLVLTLVINVDLLAFFIKLEFQAAGKFNLMTKSLFVNLDDDLAGDIPETRINESVRRIFALK